MLDFKDNRYYLVENDDGTKEIVFSAWEPHLGRKFDPLTGEEYGSNAIAVTEITEAEVLDSYHDGAVTLARWFGFKPADYTMIDGKPHERKAKGFMPVLDKESKRHAKGERYEVWERYAPYTVKLPDGSEITCNERGETIDLILLDKDACACYEATFYVDDKPIKQIKEWMKTHKI